jgi:hypothetical protein
MDSFGATPRIRAREGSVGSELTVFTCTVGCTASIPDIRRPRCNRQSHPEQSLVVDLGSRCGLGARNVSDLASSTLRINLDEPEA